MSADETTTRDLIQTLEDGKEGFAKGAEKLDKTNSPEIAVTFRRFSAQRDAFAQELRGLAVAYGDDADLQHGSLAGTLHRGWMSLKDALSGSDPDGVLDAAEQGEDHAVKEYDKARDADISPELRVIIERQYAQIKAAHDEVQALRSTRR